MLLETPILETGRFTEHQKKALKKLKIETVEDLLYHFPVRYGDFNEFTYIKNLKSGEHAIIYGKIKSISAKKTFKTGLAITEAILEESTGDNIKLIWFSQPYISKILSTGSSARFSGIISERSGKLYMTNPEFDEVGKKIPLEKSGSLFETNSSEESQIIFPVYKESKGITSKWIFHKIKKILSDKEFLEKTKDPIPKNILKKYNLPSFISSLIFIHLPKKKSDYQSAKKRFSYEEIFYIQLVRGIEKKEYSKSGAYIFEPTKIKEDKIKKQLGFELTSAQKKVMESIKKDLKSNIPMSRLLEGDVGSGKTVIAALTSYFAASTKPKGQNFGHSQVAYMAPTEILAKQIFSEFKKILGPLGISLGLLTSKDVRKFPSKISNEETKISKKKLLDWILNGEIQITIGTHALISKNVFFENLGLIIIDEQHRFGKKQRATLRQKSQEKKDSEKIQKNKSKKIQKKGLVENDNILPHMLSMTATPIPRTLALTIYGDLDISVMDELPPGRKKIDTQVYIDNEGERKKVYFEVEKELKKERQMYVICPRIDDPDPDKKMSLNLKSAVSTQKHFQKHPLFKKYNIGLLHSKLSKDEKNKVMEDFEKGKIDILVSTSVVEVGVSVANATVMIIEGGERFGLSQLHQFRGRVMRSSHQPYCYIFANTKNEKSLERLSALKKSSNGFELAEYDLKFRGSGEIMGNKQSGISDLAMEAISNIKLVELARNEAQNLIEGDKWKKEKKVVLKLEKISRKVHME